MSGKYALIIGNTEYIDPGLAQLTAPGKDTEDFARILKNQEICGFDDVRVLLNQTSAYVIEAIDEFFEQRKPEDLLVLYFSGHGVRDELGILYLAVKNSNRFRLRSTAIKSDFVREAMDQSRSKRQVLILDCCNSGAFPQGTKAATGVSIGTASAFEAGYGRIILTASDSTQFAWEGDKVIGETSNSLFTHFLVKGLDGAADLDSDGRITVDELYDYAYEQVKRITPKQTPSKFSTKQQGEIVLRPHIRVEDIKPVSLPGDLRDEIEDTRPYVREAAVLKLEKLLSGKNIGLALSAKEALEKIAVDDNTTRRVAQMATRALESVQQVEEAEEPDRTRRTEREPTSREFVKPGGAVEPKSETVPLAAQGLIKPRTMISRRVLYTGIITILVIGLALWVGSFALRNRGTILTPTRFATEDQLVDVNAPLGGTLSAKNTDTATLESPSATLDITPSSIATTITGTDVSIAVNRAYLYKGPALAHGLAVQKSYARGEIFLVIARDSSGLWLFGRAPDGNEGWLYIAWIDSTIDPMTISTASIIPTMPITPTRRPNAPDSCDLSPDFCGGNFDPVTCTCV
jgi:hypothetical protein